MWLLVSRRLGSLTAECSTCSDARDHERPVLTSGTNRIGITCIHHERLLTRYFPIDYFFQIPATKVIFMTSDSGCQISMSDVVPRGGGPRYASLALPRGSGKLPYGPLSDNGERKAPPGKLLASFGNHEGIKRPFIPSSNWRLHA